MDKFEKILNLIDENKTAGEIKETFPEEKDFIETYGKLRNIIEKGSHIPIEILGEYVEFLNTPNSNLKIEHFKPIVEEHLKSCNRCQNDFKILNAEFDRIKDYVNNKLIARKSPKEKKSIFTNFLKKKFIYSLAPAAIVVGILLFLFNASFLTPDSVRVIYNNASEIVTITRGEATPYFQKFVSAIENNNLNLAAYFIDREIKNSYSPTIFYSYYLAGLTHLNIARRSIGKLFLGINSTELEKAINYFKLSLKTNKFKEFENIKLKTYFYLGSSYFLAGNYSLAREFLTKVEKAKGNYFKEAKIILNSLNEN